MKIVTAIVLLLCCTSLSAQDYVQLKADNNYLTGEGWGSSVKQADENALQDLISKISVSVKSSFSSIEEESATDGGVESSSSYRSVINTYSQATLNNTQRIVVENEPDVHVMRFIKTSEINRIFESRKAKVLDMVECAEVAERKLKIDDALRYYYWAYCMLKSLQYSNEVRYRCHDGKEKLLAFWIPEKMKQIFSGISMTAERHSDNQLLMSVLYQGQEVESLDYTYFDGMDWSNIYSARNGVGVADLRPGQFFDHIRVKCEYEYAGESHIDREVENVLALTGNLSFRNAYINVKVIDCRENKESQNIIQEREGNDVASEDLHQKTIADIIQAINNKSYLITRKHFTDKGWEQFQKLIQYGNVTVLESSKLDYLEFGDKTICRGLTMSFSFKNNKRTFVEDVVLTLNEEGLVTGVSFGLDKSAYDDIMNKGVWDFDSRMILVNFLEEYKTAYALKDIDYIRDVFDDNAVIITGRVIRRPVRVKENSPYLDSRIIKYNRQTKDKYIKNLEHCFAGNEFINIRFADNDVVKAGKGGETYGIQIKQDYYSSTYGDSGYLFLIVDINNPDAPIIKVRTWQPDKDPDFGLYGLKNF